MNPAYKRLYDHDPLAPQREVARLILGLTHEIDETDLDEIQCIANVRIGRVDE